MAFERVVDPEQLALLPKVFEVHCQSHDITGDADREAAAIRALELYNSGITAAEGLTATLDSAYPYPLPRLIN